MFSRVNTLQAAPERIDDVARVTREVVLPAIRDLPGFRGYVVLGSRESGKAIGVTFWETETAMRTSDTTAQEIRPRVEQATAGTMMSVDPYEVLLFEIQPSVGEARP